MKPRSGTHLHLARAAGRVLECSAHARRYTATPLPGRGRGPDPPPRPLAGRADRGRARANRRAQPGAQRLHHAGTARAGAGGRARRRARDRRRRVTRPPARHPGQREGPDRHGGAAHDLRLGHVPRPRAGEGWRRARAPARRRCRHHGEDRDPRARPGHDHQQPFLRPDAEPVEPGARARRLERRRGGGHRGAHGAPPHRHRRRRLDPLPRRLLRRHRAQADARSDHQPRPVRRRRHLVLRPRPPDAQRARRGARGPGARGIRSRLPLLAPGAGARPDRRARGRRARAPCRHEPRPPRATARARGARGLRGDAPAAREARGAAGLGAHAAPRPGLPDDHGGVRHRGRRRSRRVRRCTSTRLRPAGPAHLRVHARARRGHGRAHPAAPPARRARLPGRVRGGGRAAGAGRAHASAPHRHRRVHRRAPLRSLLRRREPGRHPVRAAPGGDERRAPDRDPDHGARRRRRARAAGRLRARAGVAGAPRAGAAPRGAGVRRIPVLLALLALAAPAGAAVADAERRGARLRLATAAAAAEVDLARYRLPAPVGSLDRRSETVAMYVRPTFSLYAPFYQSSRGYGLAVAGTAIGLFDVAASDLQTLAFRFEAGTTPESQRLRFHVFVGPEHATILDGYTRLTGRPFVPPAWAFLHWRWRDTLDAGPPALLDGVAMNAEVVDDVTMYEALGIPPGVYHFDRPVLQGEYGFARWAWDETRLPNPDAMLAALRRRGYRIMTFSATWQCGAEPGDNGLEAQMLGFLAPGPVATPHCADVGGTSFILDVTDPAARAWWRDQVAAFVQRYGIDGIKLDRGEEHIPSATTDVWADGRTGREVHNAYPDLQTQIHYDALAAAHPDGDFVLFSRAGYTGTPRLTVFWGGDIPGSETFGSGPGTDLGLRSAIISQLRAAFLGAPIWGSDTGGYYQFKDREVFARWLEFSAFSGIMEIGGTGTHAPWDMPTAPRYDQEMIDIYRRYTQLRVTLHHYIVAAAREAGASGMPIARPLVFLDRRDRKLRDLWDQYLFGPDLMVAPVWKVGERRRPVYFPRWRWRSYVDPTERWRGPRTVMVDAPLDTIPVFVRGDGEVPVPETPLTPATLRTCRPPSAAPSPRAARDGTAPGSPSRSRCSDRRPSGSARSRASRAR